MKKKVEWHLEYGWFCVWWYLYHCLKSWYPVDYCFYRHFDFVHYLYTTLIVYLKCFTTLIHFSKNANYWSVIFTISILHIFLARSKYILSKYWKSQCFSSFFESWENVILFYNWFKPCIIQTIWDLLVLLFTFFMRCV